MSYPKWRHHPEMESRLVADEHEESYMAPDDQGWFDNREYVREVEPEFISEPVGSEPNPEFDPPEAV